MAQPGLIALGAALLLLLSVGLAIVFWDWIGNR